MAGAEPPRPLTGRIAIVTGGNHGIGAATAIELGSLGADVLIGYLILSDAPSGDPRRGDASDVVEECRRLGNRAVSMEADLADPRSAPALFDHAEKSLGPVDILVNNASGWAQDTFSAKTTDDFGRPTASMSVETADSQLLVDARGSGLLISEFARRLVARGSNWGRIVGLTSGTALGFPGEVSYGAAKAALENYSMSAAAELTDYGVTSNVIHPPITDTGWVTDEVREFVTASSEHTRVAQAADVAEVIGWLCTDAARMVNGNVITLR